MLLFTYKLDSYIKKIILPQILLVPNKYVMKGSFRRRIPYVTDVDIISEVYPGLNKTNIYNELVLLINRVKKNDNIIIVRITCGTDDRFKLDTGSIEELDRIKTLLDSDEIKNMNAIIEKYPRSDERLYHLKEMLKNLYKLRWSPQDVLENKLILRNGKEVKLTDTIKENWSILVQYYVKIQSYPLGIDVVFIYEPIDMNAIYRDGSDDYIKQVNYGKKYYFMLFPLKYYFRQNKKILDELTDIIEKKFGLYKQLLVRIESYQKLYENGNLDISFATAIVTGIIRDLDKLPYQLQSTIPDAIRKLSTNNTPENKMKGWYSLLKDLSNEILDAVNCKSREYFYKYLELVPVDLKCKYERNNFKYIDTQLFY